MFELLLTSLAFLAGAVASIAGFGIGSILTPFLVLKIDPKLAIAAVSIAHFIGTSFRFWKLKGHVDRKAFIHFGLLSGLGGLTGAVLHSFITSHWMAAVLGGILILAGSIGILGLGEKIRLRGPSAWIVGILSGIFGGLVGNQGGIRSAALMGFDLSKQAYVATATAVGLLVDISRMPVYFFAEKDGLSGIWPLIFWMSLGTVLGTWAGTHLLAWIPEKLFKRIVSGIVLLLGIFTLVQALYA